MKSLKKDFKVSEKDQECLSQQLNIFTTRTTLLFQWQELQGHHFQKDLSLTMLTGVKKLKVRFKRKP